MAVKLINPPVEMAVSLQMARTAARVNGSALDDEIRVNVGSATKEAEHHTGRVFIDRTFQITLDGLCGDIEAPPSAREVINFVYIDENGDAQELDAADFALDDTGRFITPAFGKAWPATRSQIRAVAVDVVCGYGPTEATVPDAVKGYILARLHEMYAAPGTPTSPFLKLGLDALKDYS